jgi:hypothetical protein
MTVSASTCWVRTCVSSEGPRCAYGCFRRVDVCAVPLAPDYIDRSTLGKPQMCSCVSPCFFGLKKMGVH